MYPLRTYALVTTILIAQGFNSTAFAPALGKEPASAKGDASLYHSINFKDRTFPDSTMFSLAMRGFEELLADGRVSNHTLITLIDFTKPSTEKRLWVIDLTAGQLVHHTLVAHGRNSGELFATKFSNRQESHQSSLGFYVTGATYQGKHGISLKLHGMEHGVNDLAEERAIVIHGADYVSDDFISRVGRLGRSYGCPAIPTDISQALITKLGEGSCVFIYHAQAHHSDYPIALGRK